MFEFSRLKRTCVFLAYELKKNICKDIVNVWDFFKNDFQTLCSSQALRFP